MTANTGQEPGGDEAFQEAVLALVQVEDGKRRMPCADALALATEMGVEPTAITRICNRLNIKISHCQLGCFR